MLDRNAFEDWLNALPDDRMILSPGRRDTTCPVAAYLNRDGKKFRVSTTCVVSDACIYEFMLPDWAKAFIQCFDVATPNRTATAGEAKAILERIRPYT